MTPMTLQIPEAIQYDCAQQDALARALADGVRLLDRAIRSDAITELNDAAESLVAQRIRQRVIEHLAQKRERELRDGLPVLPSTEQQALSLIKEVGMQLQAAGKALLQAAQRLKDDGKGMHANRAFVAGQTALKQAADLLGEGY